MKPHELRLAELHSRNLRHLRNLEVFISDGRAASLDKADRELIIKQCSLMAQLNQTLEARMRRLNIPV